MCVCVGGWGVKYACAWVEHASRVCEILQNHLQRDFDIDIPFGGMDARFWRQRGHCRRVSCLEDITLQQTTPK